MTGKYIILYLKDNRWIVFHDPLTLDWRFPDYAIAREKARNIVKMGHQAQTISIEIMESFFK